MGDREQMETRTKLMIILWSVIGMIVLAVGLLFFSLVRQPDVIKPENRVEELRTEVVKRENPWANQGDAVIALVKSRRGVPPMFPKTEEQIRAERRAKEKAEKEKKAKSKKRSRRGKKKVEKVAEAPPEPVEAPSSVDEILSNEKFVRDILKVRGKAKGWTSEWWGETKYGQSFFMVRYDFVDGLVTVGPEWLVDLKARKIAPINLLAEIVDNPTKAIKSKYYDKEALIISAIGSHRFENKMSLAGALLIYFQQQNDAAGKTDNDILGWTVSHTEENLFKAYFQWKAKGERQYAEFEFDFDKKRLRPDNFQAVEIMKVGETFTKERVHIMPQSYDPKERNPSKRWLGPSRKACAQRAFREQCAAFATMLEQSEIIESVEWLLTAREEKSGEFRKCLETRRCAWKPMKEGPNDFRVTYEYKLNEKAKEPETISWRVKPKERAISAEDTMSGLALKAVRPR